MKKYFVLLLTLLVTMLALVSCDGIFGDGGGGEPSGIGNSGGKVSYSYIICDDGELDLTEVRSKMIDLFGAVRTLGTETSPARGEVVLGDSNRDITAKAKTELESALASNKTGCDIGYIVYAEGTSIAVYWNYSDLSTLAITGFITECIDKLKMTVTDGVICTELYEKREFDKEKAWLELAAKNDPEVVTAIRKLYNFYDGPGIAGWLANLYDPEIGGFYYCNSARDFEPFKPDLESTNQALSLIVSLGAITTSELNKLLDPAVKENLVNFARDMQSPTDGYFYHPQWPQSKESLATDRYGRDQGSAMNIINRFTYDDDGDGIEDKQYPKYCTYDGSKCKTHANEGSCVFPKAASYYADAISSSKAITVSVRSSASEAVSRVQSVASVSSHPDYSSREAFRTWLEAINASIKENSGIAHNLAALIDEIISYGYQDILIDYLNKMQAELYEEMESAGEEPTAIWQRNIDYKAVWGVYKYMHIYNTVGSPIKLEYAAQMVRTCIKVIQLPPVGNYAYNDLMNQWTAITSIISNVKKHYSDDDAKELYEIIREDPIDLIENTLEKMQTFKMDDGSFCNNVGGTTSASIYGVPIALGGIREGNVNSTAIVRNIYSAICDCMGVKTVPLCNAEDGLTFIETLATIEPIEKETVQIKMHDFEGALDGTVTLNKSNEGALLEITEDPEDSENHVLEFVSPTGTSSGDAANFVVSGIGNSCYVFESKIYVSSDSAGSGTLFQIKLGSVAYMIELRRSGNTINIYENTHITSGQSYKVGSVEVNKWFKLRVEYYVNGDDNGIEAPMIKIFIDDEYVTTTSHYYGSHVSGANPSNSYAKVEILSLRSPATYAYFDDCYFVRVDKYYDPDNHSISNAVGK